MHVYRFREKVHSFNFSIHLLNFTTLLFSICHFLVKCSWQLRRNRRSSKPESFWTTLLAAIKVLHVPSYIYSLVFYNEINHIFFPNLKNRYKYKNALSRRVDEWSYKLKQEVHSVFLKFLVVYGITTGFGKFARTTIEKSKLM